MQRLALVGGESIRRGINAASDLPDVVVKTHYLDVDEILRPRLSC